MSFNPRSVRPRRNWVLVLDDQRKEVLSSGIALPTFEVGVEKVTQGCGEIIRVGQGEKTSALGLEPGQRIVFRSHLKYANPIETDEVWGDGKTKKRYFLMACEDVIAIIPPGMEVGVFSGRPQVPEKKES